MKNELRVFSSLSMQALVIRISRDVCTVNSMLNKRKSKKAAGTKPQTPLGELSVLPRPPCCHERGTPTPVPSPSCENIYQTPPPPPLPEILDPPLHLSSNNDPIIFSRLITPSTLTFTKKYQNCMHLYSFCTAM